MARTHGPVMLLRFGRVPIVVASSAAAAQEAMKTRDVAFASRYRGPMVERLHGRDMAFAPYDEHWRQARRSARPRPRRRRREPEPSPRHLLQRCPPSGCAFGNDSSNGLGGEGKILRKLLVDFGELLGWSTLGGKKIKSNTHTTDDGLKRL
jgi:hypothetical protein